MSSPTHLSSLRQSSLGENRAGRWSTVVIAVLLVFVLVATIGTIRANDGQRRAVISARAEEDMTTLDNRMATYEELLYGVRAAFHIDPSLDRRDFHELVSNLGVGSRLPGVQVIGVAHLVDRTVMSQWSSDVDADARASGLPYPDFGVHPLTDADLVMPINYIEPQAGNLEAFGLDFLSEPNRSDAVLTARDTGQSAASAPVTLVQESATQKAVLVYVPLYRQGEPTDSQAQRRAAFEGVVYAAFRMDDLTVGALGDGAADISVIDVEAQEILTGDPDLDIQGLDSSSVSDDRVGEFDVAGRTWRVLVNADTHVLSYVERATPIAIVIAGLLMAGLLVALVKSMRSARQRAVVLAIEMTTELEALTESASEGIVTVDNKGRIVAWNAAASRVFGASAEDMIGRHGHDLVPDRARTGFDRAFGELVGQSDERASSQSVVAVGLRADGTEFPAEVSMSCWWARGSKYSTGFVRDVTERVEAEQQLTDTSNLLLGVLGAVTEMAVIGTDLDGTVTVFNAGAEQLLGYSADDIIGQTSLAKFQLGAEVMARAGELGIEPGFRVFVGAARRGEAETRQWTYVRADQSEVQVELTVTPRYDESGQIIGYIAVAVDMTDRLEAKQQQEQLLRQERDMVAKLTELDQAKSDFVQTMSHELRTPLTSIIGYAELLGDTEVVAASDPSTKMVGLIEKNANRLLLLVEDLLTLSEMESGTLHATLDSCDVPQLLRSAEQAIAPSAGQHDVLVAMSLPNLPLIDGDAPELERVFLNLLSNAVKFSHRGGRVEIDAHQSRDGNDVVITITDHGIGVPEDEQSKLFGRFFRSRNAEFYSIQGSGLGLSIVADIVERHGGSIMIDSEENVGTTVTVRLPSRRADTPAPKVPAEAFA